MIKTFKLTAFLLALIAELISHTLSAQTLHLIIFADTDDPGLSAPNLQNIANLRPIADNISRYTGLQNKLTVYQGADFRAGRFDQVISNLRVASGDVLFFYFMGHGWNNSETEEPMMFFAAPGQSPSAQNSRNLKTTFEQLRQKGAHLTLVFCESCNAAINTRDKAKPGTVRASPALAFSPQQFRQLFVENSGQALVYTCRRGQKSNSSEDGGWFFASFKETFQAFTSPDHRPAADWQSLLSETAKATVEYAKEQGVTQEPVVAFRLGAPAVSGPATPSGAVVTAPNKPSEPIKPTTTPSSKPDVAVTETSSLGNTATGPCLINRTAYNAVRENLVFLTNFRNTLMNTDPEEAAQKFQKFYSADRKEFFSQMVRKLNIAGLPADEVKWFEETSHETAEMLDETDYYATGNQFQTNAFSKLAIPIDNLKITESRLKEWLRRCTAK